MIANGFSAVDQFESRDWKTWQTTKGDRLPYYGNFKVFDMASSWPNGGLKASGCAAAKRREASA